MQVMTYNIRLGIQQGLNAIADAISPYSPDLLALQEVGHHWKMGPTGDTTATLSALTGLPHAIYVPCIKERDAQGQPQQYGHALMARWPLVPLKLEPLPQDEDEPRALLHARLEHPSGPVLILSTHLSWLISDRPAQGKLLLERAEAAIAADERLIIMGDLNEDDPSALWLESLKALMYDADHHLSRLTYPSSAPRLRLDYLLTNIKPWRDPTIIQDQATSDHFPLTATLADL